MKYKLIASDFDGTIYDGEKVEERTLDAIRRYREAGGTFVISTGRIFTSILQWLPKLGVDKPLIACQGGVVYDGTTGAALKRFPLDNAIAERVLKYLEEKGEVCHCYTDEHYYVEKKNPRTDVYSAYCNVAPVYSGEPLSTYAARFNGLNKIMGIVTFTDMAERIKEIQDIVGDMADVSQSSPVFLEVVARTAGKGNALKWLAENFGFKREEVVAVGDNLNDVSMIKYAGLGVAVANATEPTKEAADYITGDVHTGVADLIDKILAEEDLPLRR